jgi:hypothetical protein
VFINLAALVLGVAGLIPPEGGILDSWPPWLQYLWSVSILIGGTAALQGTWTGYRPAERLGAGLFAVCALMFAVGAFVQVGVAATGTITIFTFLCVAKTLRVIRSLAVSAEVHAAIRIQSHLDEGPDGGG